jgi:hypothetical protein
LFRLAIPLGKSLGVPTIQGVTTLKEADGTVYDGSSFDGEGIVSRRGEFLIASEGGAAGGAQPDQPEVRRFGSGGNELGSLEIPGRFLIGTNNASFESATLSPSGRSFFTANEFPLPSVDGSGADGETADLRNRIRILRFVKQGDEGFVPAEQFYYLTEPDRPASPSDVAVADLIAVSESRLLVLEKGFKEGEGNTVRIFLASLKHEEDVSDEPVLSAPDLSPVKKTLLVDVGTCPASGATNPGPQVNPLLDNFEGMTLGPILPGGRRALILISDDNLSAVQVTRVIALSVPVPLLTGSDRP